MMQDPQTIINSAVRADSSSLQRCGSGDRYFEGYLHQEVLCQHPHHLYPLASDEMPILPSVPHYLDQVSTLPAPA